MDEPAIAKEMRKRLLLLLLLPVPLLAQPGVSGPADDPSAFFTLAGQGSAAGIYFDRSEEALVGKAAAFLAADVEKVTGILPRVVEISDFRDKRTDPQERMVLVGTLGNNSLIEKLIDAGKLDAEALEGKWEAWLMETVADPFPGVKEALVILGSDRRGAAYGVFALSEAMGVSPWYWWADVPVQTKEEIHLEKGRFLSEGPKVKYRGIFLNDEAPALRNWATEKFGGFNHRFYEKVFELILRSRGNYLWPAMWVPAKFYADDSLNAVMADQYGIVMATTHHEPMMRAHAEWYSYGGGDWNYVTNREKLQDFWRGGVERISQGEAVVTVGMRGDGDEAMSEETAVELMQDIIADQRQIIIEVTGKPAAETPQAWAVYKEVQDYYDRGMRVDEDILVLFCDDNWGNLRILPKAEDLDHAGGYGIYYHFDYVGAPVSYRWLNVSQIERTWEQMNLAWEAGVEDLWLVNVGDLKPMELPISFFLDFAWDPEGIRASDLPAYYSTWAEQQFGEQYSGEIGRLLALYTKYNARRTPEMLKPDTYSLENYREADRVLAQYRELRARSRNLYEHLPQSHKPAFYQLVHSPIELCCNLNEMYVAAGKNHLYAAQGRASANRYADSVKRFFERDAELTREFHEDLLDGKWNHMMSQTHIGYTSWNNPETNIMPETLRVQPAAGAAMGFVIEHGQGTSFPSFDPVNRQSYYLEIFNKGDRPLEYSLEPGDDWILLSKTEGSLVYDEKVLVGIDWEKAPEGSGSGSILLKGGGKEFSLEVPCRKDLPEAYGFVENNGVVSIEAVNYHRRTDGTELGWEVVPNLGRTHSALMAGPVTAPRSRPGKGAPLAEYDFTVFEAGELVVEALLSPTQDFKKGDGLWYAVAIDGEEPQIVNMNRGEEKPDYEYADWWMESVGDHIKVRSSTHRVDRPGVHTLKVWMMDPGIVFQKFIIDAGGKRPSYLGAPESTHIEP